MDYRHATSLSSASGWLAFDKEDEGENEECKMSSAVWAITISAMLSVMAVTVIGDDATVDIQSEQEDSEPTFDRTTLEQHRLLTSKTTYCCTSIEESDESLFESLLGKLKLSGGNAKSFKLEYALDTDSDDDGQWRLKSKLDYEDEQSITYYVVMSPNGEVVSETTCVRKEKKTMAKPGPRGHGKKQKGKKETQQENMKETQQENMTVREEKTVYFGKSTGISKVIRFTKDGQSDGTELAIPKDDIVLTFFQIPVFAGTIKNAPKGAVPFRCVHQGQPFPAVLKLESDHSNEIVYSVYKSSHALSLEPAEDAKPIFRLFFSRTDKFSLPDKIVVDLDGTMVTLAHE